MTTITKALGKGAIATVAAGAMAMATATPAAAEHRDRDGISAGEVIAGAVILGGLAAILSSGKRDRYRDDYRYRDGYRGDYGYNSGYSSRQAVEACVHAAERAAQRYTGSRAEVYEVRDIDRKRSGYEVEGRIAVRDNHGYRNRGYRDRGWGDYRRGYRNDGWDEGRFKCEWSRGRVVDVDFSGIRGLR